MIYLGSLAPCQPQLRDTTTLHHCQVGSYHQSIIICGSRPPVAWILGLIVFVQIGIAHSVSAVTRATLLSTTSTKTKTLVKMSNSNIPDGINSNFVPITNFIQILRKSLLQQLVSVSSEWTRQQLQLWLLHQIL